MKWYDAFLDLDFLSGPYFDTIKNLSLVVCVGLAILGLIALMYETFKQDSVLHVVFSVILISYTVIYVMAAVILVVGIVIYPPAIMSALLKNFIIIRCGLTQISTACNIILNIIIAFTSCFVWFGFITNLLYQYSNTIPTIDE